MKDHSKTMGAYQGTVLLTEYKGICIQVYNVRTGNVEYSLHKGATNFLFHDKAFGIQPLDRVGSIKILEKLNDLVLNSNFKAFRIASEDEQDKALTIPTFTKHGGTIS
jgi:hypothetical protein